MNITLMFQRLARAVALSAGLIMAASSVYAQSGDLTLGERVGRRDDQGRALFTPSQREQVYQYIGVPPVESNQVFAVRTTCRKEGKDVAGDLVCSGANSSPGFLAVVEENVRKQLAKENRDYYSGRFVDPTTGIGSMVALPICNIAQGEVDRNFLGDSCGDNCKINVRWSGFPPRPKVSMSNDRGGACSKEYGWLRGAYVQLMAYYRDQVFSEFRGGEVKLFTVRDENGNEVRPCQEAAADVLRIGTAGRKAVDRFIELAGSEAKASQMECRIQQKKTSQLIDELGTSAGKLNAKEDPVSHGTCLLTAANTQIRALWSRFLGCELRWRARTVMDSTFRSDSGWFDSTTKSIKNKCDGKRSERSANNCYKGEVRDRFRDRMQQYSAPVDLPAENQQSSAAGALPGLAFGLMGLVRPRRRKISFASARLLTAVGLVALVLGAGCSSKQDKCDFACQPCQTVETQNCGCVYQQCLATFKSSSVLFRENTVTITENDIKGKTWEAVSGTQVADRISRRAQVCFRALDDAGLATLNASTDKFAALSDPAKCKPTSKETLEAGEMSVTFTCDIACDARNLKNCPKDLGFGTNIVTTDCRPINDTCWAAAKGQKPPSGMTPYQEQQFYSLVQNPPATGCPSELTADKGPEITAGVVADATAVTLADLNNLIGFTKDTAKAPDQLAGSAATAGQAPDHVPGATGTTPSNPAGGSPAIPTISINAPGGAGGVGGAGAKDRSGFSKDSGFGGPGLAKAPQPSVGSAVQSLTFGSGNSGTGRGGSKSGSLFGDLFGAQGNSGPAGGGGVTSARVGAAGEMIAGEAAAVDLDAYLQKVGSVELFEVVNRRMDRWGREL